MTNTAIGAEPITTSATVSTAITATQAGPARTTPVGPWGVALRVVVALAITLAAYGPTLLIGTLPGLDPRPDALAGNWGLALLKQVGPLLLIPITAVLLLAVVTRWLDRRPFAITGIRFDRRWLPALLLGTAISVAIIVPVYVLADRMGLVERIELTYGSEPVWVGVVSTLALGFVMQGMTEEFAWRGWLTQSIGGGYHRQALIAAVTFGLIHLVSNGGHATFWAGLVYIGNAAAFGYAAAALYFATGSLWAAVGIHGGLHLGYYLAMNLGVTGGPATEAITLVLYALIGYAILRRLPAKASAPAADQVAAQA